MATTTPAPYITIPASQSAVSVSIIDTTSSIVGDKTSSYLTPAIKGHEDLAVPCISFLIQHKPSGRSLLFDLGIRRDWHNLSPSVAGMIKEECFTITVTKDLPQILREGGVDPGAIEAIIWSHHHFDHVGDPSLFGASTALVVGPGFCDEFMPGYPADPEGEILESDYAGREVREINFSGPGTLNIGRFRAFDYFGDGSFYLLDAPGHAIGHLSGLARVATSPASFILMGADAANHGGEMRPTAYLPLPDQILPHPFWPSSGSPCPGHIFEPLLRRRIEEGEGKDWKTTPFYTAPGDASDEHVKEQTRTVSKLQELDARDDVFVVLAHDQSLFGVVDFFPAGTADRFVEKGWVERGRWRFLRDFAGAVGTLDMETK